MIMMNEQLIPCDLHDYVEIACLYGYRVRLKLKNGLIVEGCAQDVTTSAEKREFLVIECYQQWQQHIALDSLAEMRVLTPQAKFKTVYF